MRPRPIQFKHAGVERSFPLLNFNRRGVRGNGRIDTGDQERFDDRSTSKKRSPPPGSRHVSFLFSFFLVAAFEERIYDDLGDSSSREEDFEARLSGTTDEEDDESEVPALLIKTTIGARSDKKEGISRPG